VNDSLVGFASPQSSVLKGLSKLTVTLVDRTRVSVHHDYENSFRTR
jgi:hypothetical protein